MSMTDPSKLNTEQGAAPRPTINVRVLDMTSGPTEEERAAAARRDATWKEDAPREERAPDPALAEGRRRWASDQAEKQEAAAAGRWLKATNQRLSASRARAMLPPMPGEMEMIEELEAQWLASPWSEDVLHVAGARGRHPCGQLLLVDPATALRLAKAGLMPISWLSGGSLSPSEQLRTEGGLDLERYDPQRAEQARQAIRLRVLAYLEKIHQPAETPRLELGYRPEELERAGEVPDPDRAQALGWALADADYDPAHPGRWRPWLAMSPLRTSLLSELRLRGLGGR